MSAPLFADAGYLIALLHREDALHVRAVRLATATAQQPLVTTEPVLGEVLAHVSGKGAYLRGGAVRLIRDLKSEERVTIVSQTSPLFDEALDLYEQRPDKGYSLVDCLSMVVCRRRRIKSVLTADRHFAQEGFEVLL